MIKNRIIVLLIITSVILLCGCRNGELEMNELKITCFDVGKGDAILLEYG